MHASGIVKRLVKSRIELFTRRERDRSGGFREKETKAARHSKKTGTARRGGATLCSVSQFLSIEAFADQWLVPTRRATPQNAETLQKPEKRELPISTQ